MSTTTADAGPNPDREQARELIEVIEDLPTLTREEVVDRHASPQQRTFADEIGPSLWESRYRPSRVGLPGFGEEREDCGAEIPHVCEDCGHVVEVGRTCAQSRCPRCAPKWVIDRATPVVSRVMQAAKMKNGAVYKHHGVISPPPDLLVDADDPEGACIDMIQDLLRTIDFDGVVLYHPWSGADDDGDVEQDDRGEWKKRLFADREWEGDVREELEHRPHFHVIGACSWFPGAGVTDRVYDETGWLIHRITERNGSPVSLGTMESVARAVTYALSHVGIDCRGEANRYVRGKVGSAYHAADQRLHDDAREVVNYVAPDTLGVPKMDVECRAEALEAETDHDIEDLLEQADDAEEGTDAEPTDDDPEVVPCSGRLVDPEDAEEFVTDEDWQQTALHAEAALEVVDKWREAGGWQAWTDGITLQELLEDVGDPPPD